METLAEAVELYRPVSDKNYEVLPEAEEVYQWETTKTVLNTWKELVAAQSTTYMSEADFLKIQDEVKVKSGTKGKNLFMPIRVAVIGKPQGTELKMLVPLLHKKTLISRSNEILNRLQG